jgi:hypothetical protein
MKQIFLKRTLHLLRISAILVILFIYSFSLVAFRVKKFNEDVWKLLGMTKEAGNEGINMSFMQGYLYFYNAKGIKNIAFGNRPAVANDLLSYTKQFINSETFKNQYSKARNDAKPREVQLKPVRTKEVIQKELITETEKSIKEFEKGMKELTADLKKSMEPLLVTMKKQLEEYKNPDNKMFDIIMQGEKYDNEAAVRSHEEDLKKWENDYPADMKILIKKRLIKLLDLTKDVDFNAELVEKFGKKRFVNPVYERKPTEWKQAFRAGKEVSDITRAFAEQWLKELN